MMTAALPQPKESAEVARRMLVDLQRGRTMRWRELDLPQGTDVAIARMGPVVAEEEAGAYQRDRRGADIADDPRRAWSAGRGYWRLAPPGPRHLVLTRLGRVLGVYRTDDWSQVPGGRIWATRGWLVDVETKRLVAVDRDSGRAPRICDEDVLIGRFFHRIRLLGYPEDQRGSAIFRIDDSFRRRKNWTRQQ
jgi:hypothetical protein